MSEAEKSNRCKCCLLKEMLLGYKTINKSTPLVDYCFIPCIFALTNNPNAQWKTYNLFLAQVIKSS